MSHALFNPNITFTLIKVLQSVFTLTAEIKSNMNSQKVRSDITSDFIIWVSLTELQ